MTIIRGMNAIKGQLTLRGVVIGCVGCAVITASSVYVALKMGALPWPIVFAAILSLFLLKLISRGTSTLNEANVTHTIMSSGAMVAGGLAFTVPGAWMLGLAEDISLVQMLALALSGSALGLLGSILLRRHFIEDVQLEYPIGQAAAQTLKAGDAGGGTGAKLFGAMGLAGVYTLLRDGLGLLPRMLAQLPIPGVTFGIYNSPMMLAVGFLVGTGAVAVWFAGAVLANFGIIVGGPALGLCTTEAAQAIVSCLGMGCMMGAGIAVVGSDIAPQSIRVLHAARRRAADAADEPLVDGGEDGSDAAEAVDAAGAGDTADVAAAPAAAAPAAPASRARTAAVGALVAAAVALVACLLLGFSPLVSVAVVLATFVACAMSAQSVGQTGIDPMEIFGLIVLLLVAVVVPQVGEVRLFFVAALVAVACGLAGDVMNDFKAGHVLGTSPRAQWVGQAVGAAVGSVVAVLTMWVLLGAYGPEAFGVGREFVSAQASVVATMVGGVPNLAAFVVGLVTGCVLYLFRFPSMMLGLGIYLPFYMSFTAFLGAMAKVAYDAVMRRRRAALAPDERAAAQARASEAGLVVASGLLGGESIVGIVLAIAVSAATLAM